MARVPIPGGALMGRRPRYKYIIGYAHVSLGQAPIDMRWDVSDLNAEPQSPILYQTSAERFLELSETKAVLIWKTSMSPASHEHSDISINTGVG